MFAERVRSETVERCEGEPRFSFLVLGATGTVGGAVVRVAQEQDFRVITPRRDGFDFVRMSENDIERFLRLNITGAIINCAVARTTVDQAEQEKGDIQGVVWLTNVVGPEKIARVCARLGKPFIHLSTDYVLGGDLENCPHKEDEAPSPISWYAISKLESEKRVTATNPSTHVVRIQRPLTHTPGTGRSDFLRNACGVIEVGGEYLGITDQLFTPVLDVDAARAILQMSMSREYGIWHVSSPTITTPYDVISQALFELEELGLALNKTLLKKVTFADFTKGHNNIRPQHTAFDISKFETNFGKGTLRPLAEVLREWARGYVANFHQ